MRTETGIVEAIEAATRTVTLKKTDGTVVTTVAGPDIKRFAELKVGDKVTARYLREPRRPAEEARRAGRRRAPRRPRPLPSRPCPAAESQAGDHHRHDHGHQPGSAVDHVHRADRLEYTSKVQDKAALANVKVGDKVDIVWTEALLVSVERGK